MGRGGFGVKGQGRENCNSGNMNRPARHVHRNAEVTNSPSFDQHKPKKTPEADNSGCRGFGRLPAELRFQRPPFRARLFLGENELPSV